MKIAKKIIFIILLLGSWASYSVEINKDGEDKGSNQLVNTALHQQEKAGRYWLQKMQTALREKEFQASFILLQPSGLQSYRWIMQTSDSAQQFELIEALNGPLNQAIRIDQKVIYYAPNSTTYAVQAHSVAGPIPPGIYSSYEKLSQGYLILAVGGGRVVDREAQHIRLVPKDKDRYLFSLWIDKITGLLLGIHTYTPDGSLLEQVLLTSLSLGPHGHYDFSQIELDWQQHFQVSDETLKQQSQNWKFGFLPIGFEQILAQQTTLPFNHLKADHYLFSDGMTDFSVCILDEAPKLDKIEYQSLFTLVSSAHKGYNVVVVGKIPLDMAQQIADSVRHK